MRPIAAAMAASERERAREAAVESQVAAGRAQGNCASIHGARNTPQYAIIDPQGVLRYAGAIDDTPSSRAKNIAGATDYVRAALDAGLAGSSIAVAQTEPYGCDVKY